MTSTPLRFAARCAMTTGAGFPPADPRHGSSAQDRSRPRETTPHVPACSPRAARGHDQRTVGDVPGRHHTGLAVPARTVRASDRAGRPDCQLETKGGRTTQVGPRDAAVRKHFYSIDIDGGRSGEVEEALGKIEGVAAGIVKTLAEGGALDISERPGLALEDRAGLALFISMSHLRTPIWREQTKSVMEQMTDYMFAETHRNRPPEEIRKAFVGTEFETLTDDEIIALRDSTVRDLDEGRIGVEMPVNAMIGHFLSAAAFGGWMLFLLDWTVVRTGVELPFIVGDTPVSVYDPTPRDPRGAAGVMSSPNAQVFIPLDPTFGVLIQPYPNRMTELWDAAEALGKLKTEEERVMYVDGKEGGYSEADAADGFVKELNLRTYASAQRYVYGAQKAVCDTRSNAKANPRRLAELTPRPGALHVLEDDPYRPGVMRERKRFVPVLLLCQGRTRFQGAERRRGRGVV